MLNLEIVNLGHDVYWTNCLDDCIASLCKYYGIESRLTYINSWNFKYTSKICNKGALFSELIDTSFVSNRYELLETHHRISMKYHYSKDYKEILKIVKEELDNSRPTCIKMDSFYLDWDAAFNKGHFNHVCMPVEVDDEKEYIVVLDSFNKKTNLQFPKELLQDAGGFCITFDVDKEKNEQFDGKEILKSVMKNLFVKNNNYNAFDSIRLFADDYLKYFDPDMELTDKGGCFKWGNFHSKLIEVTFGRSFFNIALKYIANKENDEKLLLMSNRIRRMISKWTIIISIMSRTFLGCEITPDNQKNMSLSRTDYSKTIQNVYNNLLDIADYEEKTAELILEILEGNTDLNILVNNKDREYNNFVETKPYFVNLESLFNNKGFGSLDGPYLSDFTGLGVFMLQEDIPDGPFWCVEDMKFQVGELKQKVYDNISCMGQTIEFEPQKCSRVCFLVTAEWGSFYEMIKLWNVKDECTEIYFGITDFVFNPKHEEKIAWIGRTALYDGNSANVRHTNAKIFAITCNLKEINYIRRIQLPKITNIHVFAITLM